MAGIFFEEITEPIEPGSALAGALVDWLAAHGITAALQSDYETREHWIVFTSESEPERWQIRAASEHGRRYLELMLRRYPGSAP